MGIVIVQLSDIHLSVNKPRNPVLERVDALCGAIRSALDTSDHCIIVFSGDIADWGKAEEYNLALGFIDKIYSEIKAHIKKTPLLVIIPGNHDLDFEVPDFDEKLREMIIDNCSQKNPPNDAMVEYCLKPQSTFKDFTHSLSKTLNTFSIQSLVDSKVFKFDSIAVRFNLLNTTSFSRKQEVPQSSWFPIANLEDNFKEGDEAVTATIGVLHHPYIWSHPDSARELKRILESRCDIVLTGHEHAPDIYKKARRSTEQNLYVEGGTLQDHDKIENSFFNIIKIEAEQQKFLCTTFTWDGALYEPLSDPYEHRYLRLRQPLINEFRINESWDSWLEQVGTDFRHPRCRNLKLSDLFIYPDLQRLNVRKACSPAGIVRDCNVVGFIQEKKRVLIAGAEKTGKTSFSKKLFIDLRDAGYVPLLIRSDFNIKKNKGLSDSERIRNALDKTIERIYSTDSTNKFWQTKVAERALIVDDYERLPIGDGGRDKLARYFEENFGLIVFLSDPGIRITDILNRTEDDTLLWTFEHADILECDAEARYLLTRNWLLIGLDYYETSIDEVYQKTIRYGQIIDAIIGQGAIPSLPLFITMMMQQLETRGNLEGTTGLYGSLFELIIRDVIKGAAGDPADLEVKLNYLSEFAYSLYSSSKRFLDEAAFFEWHDRYCETYNCRLNSENMILKFEAIGVFRREADKIGFKYRYYYCFFFAQYLANNMHGESAIKIVRKLCSELFNTNAANTMLFLCHLSSDPRILSLILEIVRGHFRGVDEYDLSKSHSVLPKGTIRPARLALSDKSPEEERVKALQTQDDTARPHGLDEMKNGDVDKQERRLISLINEANSAHNAIRICGQVIRNFYGKMIGDKQIEVIRESYGICLRMMYVLFEFLERDKEEIASVVAEILQHRYPDIKEKELDNKVRISLQVIAMSIAYGLIKHTSNSLGLAALKTSFDKLISGQASLSHRMLDLSTRLDYFDTFPEENVLKIAEELDDYVIGHEVLRVLVWENLKLFKPDYRIRQRVCEKLRIEAKQAILISPKDKRLPEK